MTCVSTVEVIWDDMEQENHGNAQAKRALLNIRNLLCHKIEVSKDGKTLK